MKNIFTSISRKIRLVLVSCCMVLAFAFNALAVYTPPTDVESLWALIGLDTFNAQLLSFYGLGALMLLSGLGWRLLKKGSKRAIAGV